jgi:hypothetical protein
MGDETQDPSQTDWEGEGGSIESESKQTTAKGLEIPIPKRKELMDAFRKIVQPAKRV